VERSFQEAKGEMGLDHYEVLFVDRVASTHHPGFVCVCFFKRHACEGNPGGSPKKRGGFFASEQTDHV
jgi:hypothetical protein